MKAHLLAALFVAGASSAASPPLEFRGVRIGDPSSVVAEKLPQMACAGSVCTAMPLVLAKTKCPNNPECFEGALREHLWGSALPRSYSLAIVDGMVDSVRVSIIEGAFSSMIAGLVQKYGKPSYDKTKVVQNGFGAKFDNRTVIWDRPDGRIAAFQRISVDSSLIQIMSKRAAEEEAAAGTIDSKGIASKL